MKNKIINFALIFFAFFFIFNFNYKAYATEENYTFTYDYDSLKTRFELSYWYDNINLIINDFKSLDTGNRAILLTYKPLSGLEAAVYTLNGSSDNFQTINWFNLTNNVRYITTGWAMDDSQTRNCYYALSEINLTNDSKVTNFINNIHSCLTTSNVQANSRTLAAYQESASNSFTFGNYTPDISPAVLYVTPNINLKYAYSRIITSSQSGQIWKNLKITANGEDTTYTIGDTIPTFDDIGYTPPVNYEINGTALFDYTDYIYNQLNWLNIKQDIIDSISEYNGRSSNNKLIINWVENLGIEVIVVENSLTDLDFYLGSDSVLYNDNNTAITHINNIQGIGFNNKKYLSIVFPFTNYIQGSIKQWVSQNIDIDLTSLSSSNYSRVRQSHCSLSEGCTKTYLYDKNNLKVYPIFFDTSNVSMNYVVYSDTLSSYDYYWEYYDFIIDEDSNTISDISNYSFRPIYSLYSFSTTNGAGTNASVCRPGTTCYFDDITQNITLTGPIDSLLLIPLRIIQSLNSQISSTCNPINLTLPFVTGTIQLPCIRSLFVTWGVYDMIEIFAFIINVLLLYNYFVYLFHWIERLLQFNVHVDFLVDYYSKGKYK